MDGFNVLSNPCKGLVFRSHFQGPTIPVDLDPLPHHLVFFLLGMLLSSSSSAAEWLQREFVELSLWLGLLWATAVVSRVELSPSHRS